MERQYVKVWVLTKDGWTVFCGRMYLPHALELNEEISELTPVDLEEIK